MRVMALTILALLTSGAASLLSAQVSDVELESKTAAAFNHYIQATQARIDAELKRPGKFLYIDGLPAGRAEAVRKTLHDGQIYMERLVTRDASGEEITAPDALIHHWLGDAFVPGATIQDVLNVAQDYDHHQEYYSEVVRSRLLSRQGNDFKIFYRLRKKKVITVTLDSWHDVRYFPVDGTHWYSRSVATRIQEIANAGQKDERAKPIGEDSGFLWRLDSWWRFEEKDGGVYIECEAISLTRDIPTGLGWLIKPFVTSIPRESLQNTMNSTRSTVVAKIAAKRNEKKTVGH